MNQITFFVPGIVQTKGSVRAFTPKGWTRPILTNDNPKAKGWQNAITHAAHAAGCAPASVAVTLGITFWFSRPKAHHGTKGLRASAPAHHTQKPDIDKAVRVVLDALTGIAYRDDAQVDTVTVGKRWAQDGSVPGVAVTVTSGEEGAAP